MGYDYRQLIQGAIDLHVHSAPDILPRRMDDIEMAQRIQQSGMAGYCIKSHYFCTSERARLMNRLYPGSRAIGTVTLNSSVGGINPSAVEMAARSGARLVWFPTCDSAHEMAHVFDGDPNKKLPYWAQIVIEMKKDGIQAPTITLLDHDGGLKPEVLAVLDIIARHDMVLATGHISHQECFALVKAAGERGVKKVLVTHVSFPTTYYTIEEQQRLVELGAYLEHCYTTWATGKVAYPVVEEMIRAVGAEHIVIATDLGQKTALYPDEGMLEFAKQLYDGGFSPEEIRRMMVENPATLIGKQRREER